MVVISAFKLSIIVIFFTLIITFFLSIFLYMKNFKLKKILDFLVTLPIFLPPSIVGYLLLIILGRNSFLYKYFFSYFDIDFIFNIKGAIIAAVVVAFPIMYQNIKIAFNSIEKSYIETGLCLGLSPYQLLRNIYIPMSYKKILCGFILTCGRAFGEFGATILVAGNIPEKTQTLPLALYSAIESGENYQANIILFISLIFSSTLLIIYIFFTDKKSSVD